MCLCLTLHCISARLSHRGLVVWRGLILATAAEQVSHTVVKMVQRGKHIYMHARAYHSPREAYIYASSTMRTLALLIAYPYDDRCFSLREGLPKRLPLTARVIIDTVRKVK